MSTRRHQKGRKHRTVNRTPRPVAATAPAAGRPASRPASSPAAAPVAAAPAAVPAPAVAVAAPAPAAPAPRSEQSPEPHPEPALPRTALKTLEQLRAAGGDGTTVDDLSASVGYQPATIVRHIDTLVAAELVHQRDGRWYAVSGG